MAEIHQSDISNGLLTALPAREYIVLQEHLEWVDLPLHQVLQESDEVAAYAYFPTQGICSIIAENNSGVRSETGLIGREGFVGITILMHAVSSPSRVVVQLDGRAVRIKGAVLQKILQSCPDFLVKLLRFAHVFGVQASQTAVANAHSTIVERLARWLLMCQDRADSPHFTMTHEFLALMLTVRRPGITDALIELEGGGIIRSTRNHIEIINRQLLEERAGGSYGVPEAEYKRLFFPGESVSAAAISG